MNRDLLAMAPILLGLSVSAQWVGGGTFSSFNHFQACAFQSPDTGLLAYGSDNPLTGEGGLILNQNGLVGSGFYIWYENAVNVEDVDVKVVNGFPYYLAAAREQYARSIILKQYEPPGNPFQFDSVRTGVGRYYHAVRMRNDLVAFAAGGDQQGDGIIDMSLDTGSTWANIAILPGQPVSRLEFVDDLLGFTSTGGYRRLINNGLFLPDSGAIYRTNDGGMNWSQVWSDGTAGFSDVAFRDAQIGVASRNDGVILRTVDGGDTWAPALVNVDGPVVMTSVTFRPDGSGFAGCYRPDGSEGMILISEDEGATWTLNFSSAGLNHSRRIYDLFFTDDAHGYAATHVRPLRTNGIVTSLPDTRDVPFTLAPLLTADDVTLRLPVAVDGRVDLLDAMGREVRSLRMSGTGITFPLHGLGPGCYVLRLVDGTRVRTGRFVRW